MFRRVIHLQEGPTAAVHLRQGNCDSSSTVGTQRHGMCMALAFLPSAPPPSPPPPSSHESTTAAEDTSCSSGRIYHAPDLGACTTNTTAPGCVGSEATSSSSEPRFVMAGYEDGVVVLWDLRSAARPLGSLRVHQEPVMCLDVLGRARGRGRGKPQGARVASSEHSTAATAVTAAAGSHAGAEPERSSCSPVSGEMRPVVPCASLVCE